MKTIEIPYSVYSIESNAFKDCKSLEQIKIPNSLNTIEDKVFQGCVSLTNITLPSHLRLIKEYAFSNCSSLQKIMIPSSLKLIENFAFEGCSSLSEITFINIDSSKSPFSVIQYKKDNLKGCPSLKEIFVPSSFCKIETLAFNLCSFLSKINVSSGI